MTPDKAKQFSRLILMQRFSALVFPGLIAIVALGFAATVSLNVVVSVEQSNCSLVRWTQSSYRITSSRIVAYCDLENGTTIMAIASSSWIPPANGTRIPLQIEQLVFGTRYRVNEHKKLQ
jgi:hypothetical protein